jgi:hypothetical protein
MLDGLFTISNRKNKKTIDLMCVWRAIIGIFLQVIKKAHMLNKFPKMINMGSSISLPRKNSPF